MDWKKALYFGIALWALMFVFVSALVAYNAYPGPGADAAIIIFGVVIAYIFARRAGTSGWSAALFYGISWVVIGFVLDLLITRIYEPDLFSNWTYFLGYFLILLTPFAAARFPNRG